MLMMVEFNKSVDIAFYFQLLWLCNVRPLVLSRYRGTKFRNLGAEKQDNHLPPEKNWYIYVRYQVYFNLVSDRNTSAMSVPICISENGCWFQ